MKATWLALLAAGGCAQIIDIPDRYPASESKCEGTIKIKLLYDGKGGTADVSVPFFKGENDLIHEINEGGGILGCIIEPEILDYGYDQNVARAAYESWKAAPDWDDVDAILGWGSNDALLLASRTRDDHKPFISASYFARLAAPQPLDLSVPVPEMGTSFTEVTFPARFTSDGYAYNFFAGTDYSTGARIGMFHVKALDGKRVGFHYCTTAEFCSGAIPAARKYAKDIGLQIGRDLPVELGESQAQYNTKVIEYFNKERERVHDDPSYVPVDWVWGGNTTKTMAYLAKAIGEVNRQAPTADLPAIPPVKLIINNWGFDEMMFAQCGTDCVGSVYGILPFVAYGDTSAGDMGKVTSLHDKWRQRDGLSETFRNVRYVQGYVNVLLFKKAVEKVVTSGLPVNGENIKEALETFTNVETGGLTEPLSFSPEDHRPQSSETIYKLDGTGKLVGGTKRNITLEKTWLGW